MAGNPVMPVQAGIHADRNATRRSGTPACAGVTRLLGRHQGWHQSWPGLTLAALQAGVMALGSLIVLATWWATTPRPDRLRANQDPQTQESGPDKHAPSNNREQGTWAA